MKNFLNGKLGFSSVLLSLLASSFTASGEQITGTMSVSLVVEDICMVDNLDTSGGSINFGSLDFGIVNDLDSIVNANGGGSSGAGILVSCSNGLSYKIGIDNGANETGAVRNMLNSASNSTVAYEIYRDAARTTRWGDVNSGEELTATGDGSQQTHIVYGQVPSASTPAAGSYSDTLTVTVLW